MDVVIVTAEELLKRFTYYDYAVFIAMLACSGAIGLYCAFNGGPQNTIRQLLAADGQLPPVLVSTSLMASFISASYILGNVAEVYQNGTMYFFVFLSYCLVIPVTAHLYLPVFFNSGVLTCYEYLELRFNRLLRCLAVAFYLFQMFIYIAIQLYAPALALSNVTGMKLWSAVFAIGLVCTVYTSVGGIKAVVYTDSFQAICMIVAMLIVVILGFSEVGGFANAWKIAEKGGRINFNEASFDPTVRHTVWGLIIGAFFTNMASYATNQMMVLRYFTVSTLKRAKLVVWGNLPYLAIILTLSSLSGLMTYAYFSGCEPVTTKQIRSHDELLPYFVMVALGKRTGIPGVFVAGIFAASLSSVSSAVNALANVVYVDIVSLIWPNIPNKTGARVVNGLGVLCGLLSILLVLVAQTMGDVLQATNAINSGIGGPLLGLFSVAMFLPFVNTKGATIAFAASLGVSLWLNLKSFLEPMPVLPQLPVSTEKCVIAYLNVMGMDTFVSPVAEKFSRPESFAVHHISYVWYTAISFLITFLVAIPASFITGANNPRTMDPKLAARPFDVICPFLSKETRATLAFHLGEDFEVKKDWKSESIKGNDNAAYVPSILDVRPSPTAFQEHNETAPKGTRC